MEKIAPLLEKLAEKLGTTVEHLWQVLIAQAPIYATYHIFLGVLMILATVTYIVLLINSFKSKPRKFRRYFNDRDEVTEILNWWKFKERTGNEATTITACIVGMIIGLILTIMNLIFWCDTLYMITTALFNPEFWALDMVLRFIK